MNRLARTLLIALGIGICLAPAALAGVIHLKEGGSVEGEIKKTDDGYRVTAADGKVTTVPSEKVASIDFRASVGADSAGRGLASLRRATENLTDLKVILDRYKAFIDQNPGTDAAKDAQKDIELWKDRQARGLIKLGSKWVTAEEAAAQQEKSQEVALELRGALKQGRLKEASAVLDKAIADDPQSISLLYLRGVLSYRQEQLPPARKSFESVLAAAEDHAPTLNNLAVILWRQNAPVAALADYDRAMLAAPGSRDILDNVAEALAALPEEHRKSAVAKKVIRHFNEQDDDLQKKMAERGFVRWGATWVTEEQASKLRDQEKQIKDNLDRMSQNFDSVQARIAQIDRQIKSDQQEISLIESQSNGTDSKGNLVRLPLPQQYYDLVREINTLQGERAQRVTDLDKLRRDAKVEQQKLPTPRYTGIQKLIDVDGMPVLATRPPDTRPDTRPIADAPADR